jgi:hypothetical protein
LLERNNQEIILMTMMNTADVSACSFPYRLYRMLEEAPKAGFDDVVSWLPDGSGFAVHNRDEFVNRIMGIFFTHTKWKSFLRQLNLYNFRRLSKRRGPARDCLYGHQFLIRGDIEKCSLIQRSAVNKRRGSRQGNILNSKDGDFCLSLPEFFQEPSQEEELMERLSRKRPAAAPANPPLHPSLFLANGGDIDVATTKKNMGADAYQLFHMLPAVLNHWESTGTPAGTGGAAHYECSRRQQSNTTIKEEPNTIRSTIPSPPQGALVDVTFKSIEEIRLDGIVGTNTMAGQYIGGAKSNFTPDMADAIVSLFRGI